MVNKMRKFYDKNIKVIDGIKAKLYHEKFFDYEKKKMNLNLGYI